MSDQTTFKRRLTAILFADIAGYTALMRQDELMASTLLKRFRSVMRNTVKQYHGEIIDEMGDGMLCVFDSTSESVRCAMSLKVAFDDGPSVPVRIAVHSGLVVFEDGKIYGDSVNVASRIESMGMPGAVLISQRVRNDIRNQTDLKTKSLGTFRFKNVDEPVTVYAIANDKFLIPKKNQLKGKFEEKSSSRLYWIIPLTLILILLVLFNRQFLFAEKSIGDEIGIAILPFRNESPNNENLYFCNGMMEAVLNHLSKIGDLRVISRNSVEYYRDKQIPTKQIGEELDVGYLVNGSVQSSTERAMIFVQLIDAKNDNLIWSESYDREITDVFAVQAEITKVIADKLEASISTDVARRIDAIPTDDPIAYDYFLQAQQILQEYSSRMSYEERQDLLGKSELLYGLAFSRDSNFAEAALGLVAILNLEKGSQDYLQEYYLDTVILKINEVLAMNPDLSSAYLGRGLAYWSRLEVEKARIDFLKSIDLNPNNPMAFGGMMQIHYWDQEFIKALESAQEFFRRVKTPVSRSSMDGYYLSLFQKLGLLDFVQHYYDEMEARGERTIRWWFHILKGEFEKSIQSVENYWDADTQTKLLGLAASYLFKRDYSKSIEYYKKWEEMMRTQPVDSWLSTNDLHRYGQALMGTGDTAKAFLMFDRQKEIYQRKLELRRPDYYSVMYDLAGIESYLGNWKQAYYWLDRLENENGFLRGRISFDLFIEVDPLFDPIRNQPKFKGIVSRLKEEKEKIRQQVRDFLTVDGELILP